MATLSLLVFQLHSHFYCQSKACLVQSFIHYSSLLYVLVSLTELFNKSDDPVVIMIFQLKKMTQ